MPSDKLIEHFRYDRDQLKIGMNNRVIARLYWIKYTTVFTASVCCNVNGLHQTSDRSCAVCEIETRFCPHPCLISEFNICGLSLSIHFPLGLPGGTDF